VGQADMSYILDALRKSESERRQGRVPDLGQQFQLIHKPKKRSSARTLWISAGLVLNAAVIAVIFWPTVFDGLADSSEKPQPVDITVEKSTSQFEEIPQESPEEIQPVEPDESTVARERTTIIVPSRSSSDQPLGSMENDYASGQVPHLVEMPRAFQVSIPDLVFNSHIYASEPTSRRVMINSNYLKIGESFAGIRVERITEEGVVLSKDGRAFRVGIVRDWVSPD